MKEQNERKKEQKEENSDRRWKERKICPINWKEIWNISIKQRMTLINKKDNQILIGRRKRTATRAIYATWYMLKNNKLNILV